MIIDVVSLLQNAMALYSSSTGSRKPKTLASSSQPESDRMVKEASVDMVEEGNATLAEDQALPCTDQPHRGVDFSLPGEAGLAKDCSDTGEDKVGSDLGDKGFGTNHNEGHASEELQVPGNREGQLHHAAKALQPCCDLAGSIPDVPNEQVSGVVSDATLASGSESCANILPDCRANLNRIPCSPGST